MSKFTFICEDEPMPFSDVIITKRTFEFNADSLDSVVAEFESFLRGCGFNPRGHLEFAETYAEEHFPINIADDLDDLDLVFGNSKTNE